MSRNRSDHLSTSACLLDIAYRLLFSGRVPPNAVASYYPLIDLMVVPRRPLPADALSLHGAVSLVSEY